MNRRLEGKVALITGAARGQGRSHAVRMAQEGARIVAVDLTAQIDSVPYPMANTDDLQETERLVTDAGGQIITCTADVRNLDDLVAARDAGVAAFGHIDIVVANAGIISFGSIEDLSEDQWQDVVDVNLTGVWKTCKAVVPEIRRAGRGGSIVMISSSAANRGVPNVGHYGTAKTGVVGLMLTLAEELAAEGIRVNSIHPTTVDTDMVQNDAMRRLFLPDQELTQEAYQAVCQKLNPMNIPWVETEDVSNALLFLVSEESRYITGVQLPITAGR